MSLESESLGQHHWQSAAKPGHKDWLPLAPEPPGDAHLGGGAEVGVSISQCRPSWGSQGAIPPAWGWGGVKPCKAISKKSGQR